MTSNTATLTVNSAACTVALDSGGGAAGSFAADADFTGGTTYSTTDTIDTSGVTNPAPQAVYQTERYGNFTYTVPGLTAGRQLHRAAALRRDLLEQCRPATLQRGDQRRGGAEQLRHLRRGRGQGQGGGRAVRGDGRRAGADHHRLHDRQGQRQEQRHRDHPGQPRRGGIDSGGGAAGPFAADADFTGGNTYSTAAAIDTSGVTNPAPQAVYQTERYGNFTYTVPGLTPGASYTVRLHFAEIYWNSAGQRLFNVAINGAAVLSNFDIYAAAGGKDKAVVEQFTATADAQGRITIAYTTVKDNAKSSGIEILPTSAARRPWRWTRAAAAPGPSPATPTRWRLHLFDRRPDQHQRGTNPAPQAVYQSERYGNFTYTVPT